MPRYICKVGDEYGEWSTVVDAFVTYLMPLDEFRAYYEREYGRRVMRYEYDDRMARVEAKGTSSMLDDSLEELLSLNRCGPDEAEIPVPDVVAKWRLETLASRAITASGIPRTCWWRARRAS